MEDKAKMASREGVTYVFGLQEMGNMPKFRAKLRQSSISFVASLSCVPFGLALGWPSASNPILLRPLESEVPITIDQSAMIAGFLMIGNTLGSPLSSNNTISAKYGMLLGVALMISGWVVMWQAENIYGLLGSRFLVGLGHGYVIGQVKTYIGEMSNAKIKDVLIKQINLHMFFAVIIVYCYSSFVDFRQTSIISFGISVFVLCMLILLPATPKDLVKANRNEEAREMLAQIEPHKNPNEEIKRIIDSLNNEQTKRGLWDLLKYVVEDSDFRAKFILFTTLVFCQQGSGAPATIIYTQILFTRSHVPNPEWIAIGYVIVYFISNVIGIFISPKYNKRTILLYSALSVSLVLVLNIFVINYQLNDNLWRYTSVIVMYIYLIVHTVGLGNIPFTLISDLFPLQYRNPVVIFFVMLHSMLALIITKVFQTLITVYLFDTPFYLFLSFSSIACIIVYYFLVPEKTDNVKQEKNTIT